MPRKRNTSEMDEAGWKQANVVHRLSPKVICFFPGIVETGFRIEASSIVSVTDPFFETTHVRLTKDIRMKHSESS